MSNPDLLALAEVATWHERWSKRLSEIEGFEIQQSSHEEFSAVIRSVIAALEAAQSQAKDRNKEVFNGDHIHIENGQYVHTRTGKTLCLIGEQSVGVPAGMKLVPIELTADMKEAWDFSAGVFRDRQRLWDSVLAAAPSLPVLPVDSKPFLCNGKDWIPVSRTTLNRLGNHELIRSALGKLSPHDLGNLGLTDDESNAIEALYNLTEAADFVAVLPVDEKAQGDSDENFYICKKCGDEIFIRDGCEPTELCQRCASLSAAPAAKVELPVVADALEIAAQRFEGVLPFNWCAADGYSNGFSIASELRLMAEENAQAAIAAQEKK